MATETIIVEFKVNNKGAIQEVNQFKNSVEGVPVATKKASTGLGGLSSTMTVMAPIALAAGAAMYKLAGFMKDSVAEAAAQQTIFAQLKNSVENMGVSFQLVEGNLNDMFASLQETTKFGDTDSAATLTKLINTTGNYEAALKLLQGALDTTSATKKELGAVSEALGKVVAGNFGALADYGIVLDENTLKQLKNADAVERAEILQGILNARFGGAAQADLNTYAGAMTQLGNYYGDLKEAIGDVVIESGVGQAVFSEMTYVITKMIDVIGSVNKAFEFMKSTIDFTAISRGIDEFKASLDGLGASLSDAGTTANLQVLWIVLSKYAEIEFINHLEGITRVINGFSGAIKNFSIFGDNAGAILAGFAEGFGRSNEVVVGMIASHKTLAERTEATKAAIVAAEASLAKFNKAMDAHEDAAKASAKRLAELNEEYNSFIETNKRALEDQAFWDELPHHQIKETKEELEDLSDVLNNLPDPPKEIIAKPNESDLRRYEDFLENIETSFSDLLSKGLTGELNSFADVWNSVWGDLAKNMTGILGDAISTLFSSGSYNPTAGGMFQNFMQTLFPKDMTSGERLGYGLTGAGMVYGGYQQGGTGGIVQGAMGGAMAGFSVTGNWMGAVVGAVVGGFMASQGGNDTPTSSARITFDPVDPLNGSWGSFFNAEGQGISEEMDQLWIASRLEEYRNNIYEMNDILRIFGDSDLFDLIGATPDFHIEGGGTADQVATIFREQWLPEAMREMFEGAINQGLGNLGMSDEMITKLWEELGALTGANQIESLRTYIATLVNMSDLIDSMDWNAMLEEVGMNSMDVFRRMMVDTFDAIDMLTIGIEDMSLMERANAASQVEQMMLGVRQAELEMLRQIDQMQKQINTSIQRQIEGIVAGGLTGSDKENFYIDRVNAIMADLADGVESPEELARLMAELQNYTSILQSVMGDRFYELGYDQYVIDALTWANDLADSLFGGFRDEIQQSNDDVLNELISIYELLLNWSTPTDDDTGGGGGGTGGDTPTGYWQWNPELGEWEWVGGGTPTTPPPKEPGGSGPFVNLNLVSDVNVNSIVTVVPSELFNTYVQSVVNAEINRRHQMEQGIN